MSAEPTELWPWLALAGLGFFHGINPTMGWLFAVALGLHRRSFRTVLLSLVPIALGHATAIALVLVAALALGLVFDHVICGPGGRRHPDRIGLMARRPWPSPTAARRHADQLRRARCLVLLRRDRTWRRPHAGPGADADMPFRHAVAGTHCHRIHSSRDCGARGAHRRDAGDNRSGLHRCLRMDRARLPTVPLD